MKKIIVLITALVVLAALASTAHATTDCTFTTKNHKYILDGDCTTDETIFIPDGTTLKGKGHTITAIDPPAGLFSGAVVKNAGSSASVKNVRIDTSNLSATCAGFPFLTGIHLEGASGVIANNEIVNINKGFGNTCPFEGNAIHVESAPYDGTHPDTKNVTIRQNTITNWQKSGIICNGDVDCRIRKNDVGESSSQFSENSPNAIQIGFGAIAKVKRNEVHGGSDCVSAFYGAGIIAFSANDSLRIARNNVFGDTDAAIILDGTNNAIVRHNTLTDDPAALDCNVGGRDTGIWDMGAGSVFKKNTISGFTTPTDPAGIALAVAKALAIPTSTVVPPPPQ